MIYLKIYFIISCFLTGYAAGGEDGFVRSDGWKGYFFTVCLFMLFLLFSPLLYGAELVKTWGGKVLHELDLLLQIKFYWVYYQGGFYHMDDTRLKNADIHVFKLDYNNKNGLKHKHLRHVYGLIFKRNNYTRRKWKVVNNLVEEVR